MKNIDGKVNWITLKFVSKDLERAFHEFYISKYLWQIRLAIILGSFSYLIAVLTEIFLYNETVQFVWLKIGVAIPSFILGYFTSFIFKEFYKRYYQYFNIYFVVITSLSFILTGVNASLAYSYAFFVGVIICLVFNFAFIRQSFIKSSFTGLIIFTVYFVMIYKSGGHSDYILLTVYIFVALLLGMFIAYLTEHDSKKSYLLLLQNKENAEELSNMNTILERKVERRTKVIQNAKKILEENEARLIDANKLAGLGYWIWDVESGNVKWSDEVYKIFGLNKETFTPQIDSIMKLSPWPDDNKRNLELIERASIIKDKGEYEQKFLKSDGSIGYYRSTFIGAYNEQGKLVSIKGTVMDITTVKNYELSLVQKNKEYEELNKELWQTNNELLLAKEKAEESIRLKTEFLHNMSHEIRTPMNGIIGFTELMESADITDEERNNFLTTIQNSSYQLLKIIDDILEISTLETKQITLYEESFCLNDLIMELYSVFELKCREKNILIYAKKELDDGQSFIISDRTKIYKIVSNLLENALKFTIQGFIEMGYYLEKDNLVLYVKDTGIGISPENNEMVFQRFSQEDKELSRKQGGLGLGLSISKESAQLLGGDIHIESVKGKGATFYVTIPYKPGFVANENVSKTSKRRKNLTVLIAEDEEINFIYLEALFKKQKEFDYKILRAKNGREAVNICNENKNINLILMDIKMPIMDGYEATEKIKSKFPEIPIIVQTAYTTEYDINQALDHGCNDFISKPVDKNKLFELINKYL